MPEFVVRATAIAGPRPYPAFIIVADDEADARQRSQRRWLNIDSIEPYVERPGEVKPPLKLNGPPVSDTSFEQEYHNRPVETAQQSAATMSVRNAVFGTIGILWGGGMILYFFVAGRDSSGAYQAGALVALLLGVLMLFAGIFALIKVKS